MHDIARKFSTIDKFSQLHHMLTEENECIKSEKNSKGKETKKMSAQSKKEEKEQLKKKKKWMKALPMEEQHTLSLNSPIIEGKKVNWICLSSILVCQYVRRVSANWLLMQHCSVQIQCFASNKAGDTFCKVEREAGNYQ